MFASKAGAHQSELPSWCSTLGNGPGLTHKDYAWLERSASYKHSSLLQTFVSYGCKMSFKIVSTGPNVLKLFSSIIYEFCTELESLLD